MKQKVMNVLLGGALLLSAPLFSSCEDILGEWDRPTPASGGSGGSASEGVEYVAYTVSGSTATPGNKTATTYTEVTSSTTTWAAGTYVVSSDVTIDGDVTISGDVELILCDGKTLTVNGQIANPANSLTVYGQTGGTGKLAVNTTADDSYPIVANNILIHGGKVEATATGNYTEAVFTQNDLTIYAGTLTASATMVSVMANHAMYIYGGVTTATGGSTSAISYDTSGTGSIYYYAGTVEAIATGTGQGFGGAFTNSSSSTISYVTSTDGTTWSSTGNVTAGSTATPTTRGVMIGYSIA